MAVSKRNALCACRLATAECALALNATELGQYCLDDPLCAAILYKPAGNFNLTRPFGIFRHAEGANLSLAVRSPSGIAYFREQAPPSDTSSGGGLSAGAIAGKRGGWPSAAAGRLQGLRAAVWHRSAQPSCRPLPPRCLICRHCGGRCRCGPGCCRCRLGAAAPAPAGQPCCGGDARGHGRQGRCRRHEGRRLVARAACPRLRCGQPAVQHCSGVASGAG